MKTTFLITFLLAVHATLFSQQNRADFRVDQMLYYENENCHEANYINKYAIVYQNVNNNSQFALQYVNSFNDDITSFLMVNEFKLIYAKNFKLSDFNAASTIEVALEGMKNMNDLDKFEKSNINYKFQKKENEIRDNRMLTAYHFKVKDFDNAKEIIYYIDHGGSGVPFSFHEGFYEEMRNQGFPMIGQVVQRDEISRDGNTCTYTLKSTQRPNKKFSVVFE